jgi:hypothetical protein
MTTALSPRTSVPASESVFELGQRLTDLLSEASHNVTGDLLPDPFRERVADLAESIRRRTSKRAERDPRSLFDLDDRFVELMDRADEEASETGEVPKEVAAEIADYLEAFRTKVDRIAGYWRWQESVATICGEEADRLAARKKAADRRVSRLRNMLLMFMMARGLKKLEGDKTSIGIQQNSTASLVVDDPLKVDDEFLENQFRFTRTEFRQIVQQLAESDLRRRLELGLQRDGWEVNGAAVRAALTNEAPMPCARLVKGQHVRIR